MVVSPLLAFLFIRSEPVRAGTTADVTITAKPLFGPGAPTNFTLTFITPRQIDITWTKGASANNTLIMAKYWEYPQDRNNGYRVYYGTDESTSDTALDLDLFWGKVYYRAWSEDSTGGWSDDYAQGTKENPAMTDLVNQFTLFNNQLIFFLALGVIAIFSFLAFWRPNAILFLLAGGTSIIVGLSWPGGAANNSC